MRVAGSHWALSEAAVSDSVFIETHDPLNVHPGLDRTLSDVIPAASPRSSWRRSLHAHLGRAIADPADVLENEALYPVHVEPGKRIYLYAELDLAHGCDFRFRPLAQPTTRHFPR
jgi:hypothetical protein